jgi:aminoglycoside 6'-N-acetyltransferase
MKGERVILRAIAESDVDHLLDIRRTPEVAIWWGEAEPADFDEPQMLAIEFSGDVIGAIQWYANEDPQYRHAGVDIFLDPAVRGQGLGPDALRTMVRWLIEEKGFHRVITDPSAANEAAIRSYEKVGFRRVGVMRDYECTDGRTWHDGLLMDLLAGELR